MRKAYDQGWLDCVAGKPCRPRGTTAEMTAYYNGYREAKRCGYANTGAKL